MANVFKLYVFEILDKVSKAEKRADKIAILQEHNQNWALKDILKGSFDDRVQWNLPGGEPPYEPADAQSHPNNLTRVNKQFRFFVKGGPGDKLPAFKREKIFLDIIETIHPRDAELVINMINKKLNVKSVTKKLVQEAYPGLVQ